MSEQPRPHIRRHLMKALLPIFLGLPLLMAPRICLAGPNSGGYLILHAQPSLQFSNGSLCGWSDLRDPEAAVTQVPGDGAAVVYFVLAVFPDYAIPDVAGVTFGIEYGSPQVEPLSWSGNNYCGNFELSDPGWPASGTGTSLTFMDNPLTRRVNEICWFASYAYAGNTIKLIPSPTFGGYFGDESIPAELDEIEGFGMLGFGTKGYNPCVTEEEVLGACCDRNGQCILQTRTVCEALGVGYTYVGENTECFPSPCTPGMGACCIHGDCQLIPWDQCLQVGGAFMGAGAACDPTPCTFTESESTWGNLKNVYRGN